MQLNFTQVTYDGDLEDADRESLMELVQQYEEAQDENAAEFEAAKETVDDLEGATSEFEEADAELAEEVAEQTFLSDEEAEALSFARKREILSTAGEATEEDTEDDAEFDDMGTEGEVQPEEGEENFSSDSRDLIEGMSGVVVEEQ